MPKIDVESIVPNSGSSYPEPFRELATRKSWLELGKAAGLTQFGVSLMTIEPGGISSQRHWHEGEDEFLLMLSGELVLVEEDSETIMHSGDTAGFKARAANGHHMVNRSTAEAKFLVVGTSATRDVCHFPDIDLRFETDENGERFVNKAGAPFE